MIASNAMKTALDRAMGAALLESQVYEQAAIDRSSGAHAAAVVVVSSLAAGVAALGAGLSGFGLVALAALIGWAVFAFVTFRVATQRFGLAATPDNRGALLRALGLASSPRVFLAFAFVPQIGLLVGLAVHGWALITSVFGLRASLDLGLRPAIVSAAAGSLPMLLLWWLARVLV